MHRAETVAGEVRQVGGLDEPLAAALGAVGVTLPAGVGVALEVKDTTGATGVACEPQGGLVLGRLLGDRGDGLVGGADAALTIPRQRRGVRAPPRVLDGGRRGRGAPPSSPPSRSRGTRDRGREITMKQKEPEHYPAVREYSGSLFL